jgi:AcrR family transcriptional regulator
MATRQQPKTKRRAPLSRERVLKAALKVADADGIESLTMRKLARELGVEAMSLYNHVENKDDILNGIVDLVANEFEPPAATEDWAASIRASAISAHEALRRHPWACDLMMSPSLPRISFARVQYMDDLLRALREAGFSRDVVYTAYHALDAHIFGFSLWEAGHSITTKADVSELVAKFLREFPFDDYPDVAEHIEMHMDDGPHREVRTFEFGLDLILEGLERALADQA